MAIVVSVFDNGNVKRYDTKWYGVGRMSGVYHDVCMLARGKTFFLNSYRSAPVQFRFLRCVGWFENRKTMQGVGRWFYSGSRAEPRATWHLRVGRFFVGGESPAWYNKWRERRELTQALRAAKAGDPNYLVCEVCNNGLVQSLDGYPGETLFVCSNDKCRHCYGSEFDISAVE